MFHVEHKKIQKLSIPTLSPETEHRLKIFCVFLQERAEGQNLIARGDLPNLWQRHLLDSLQLASLIPPTVASGLDLGSGAGFPGLVLAIATGLPFTLVESHHRKAAFLADAARLVEAPVTISTARIEEAALPPSRLITARALAPLPRLLGLAAPLLAKGGVCLFPKGKNASMELTAAATGWHMHAERWQSLTDPAATVLRISEIRRARTLRTENRNRRRGGPVSGTGTPAPLLARDRDREPKGRRR